MIFAAKRGGKGQTGFVFEVAGLLLVLAHGVDVARHDVARLVNLLLHVLDLTAKPGERVSFLRLGGKWRETNDMAILRDDFNGKVEKKAFGF